MSSEYNYYSIVLKSCSNREKLAGSLEKTLLRGRMAIKMALDNIPSVIIYKGNADNIVPVFNAFAAEDAAITILPDGVPSALPISKKYRDFSNLSPNLQTLLSHVPDNLWLGEAIHRIIPASFLDEDGALVISSHALYFIDKHIGDSQSRWLIIPYNQLHDSIKTDEQNCYLSIHYQDNSGEQNDIFTIPSDAVTSIQKSIEQAAAAKRYIITLRSFCAACDYDAEYLLENAPADSQCPSCGQPIKRTILL